MENRVGESGRAEFDLLVSNDCAGLDQQARNINDISINNYATINQDFQNTSSPINNYQNKDILNWTNHSEGQKTANLMENVDNVNNRETNNDMDARLWSVINDSIHNSEEMLANSTGRKGYSIDPYTRKAIYEARLSGESRKNVAKRFGISMPTVTHIMKKFQRKDIDYGTLNDFVKGKKPPTMQPINYSVPSTSEIVKNMKPKIELDLNGILPETSNHRGRRNLDENVQLAIFKARKSGESRKNVAKLFGISMPTVTHIMQRFQKNEISQVYRADPYPLLMEEDTKPQINNISEEENKYKYINILAKKENNVDKATREAITLAIKNGRTREEVSEIFGVHQVAVAEICGANDRPIKLTKNPIVREAIFRAKQGGCSWSSICQDYKISTTTAYKIVKSQELEHKKQEQQKFFTTKPQTKVKYLLDMCSKNYEDSCKSQEELFALASARVNEEIIKDWLNGHKLSEMSLEYGLTRQTLENVIQNFQKKNPKTFTDKKLNREVTSKERELISNLSQEGKTCREIGETLGVSETTVKDSLNQYMLSNSDQKLNIRNRKLIQQKREAIAKARLKGQSYKSIGKTFGISEELARENFVKQIKNNPNLANKRNFRGGLKKKYANFLTIRRNLLNEESAGESKGNQEDGKTTNKLVFSEQNNLHTENQSTDFITLNNMGDVLYNNGAEDFQGTASSFNDNVSETLFKTGHEFEGL